MLVTFRKRYTDYIFCYNFYVQQRRRLITRANAKSKSEKFPPPHQDGQLGFPLGSSHHIDPDVVPPDVSFNSTSFSYSKEPFQAWSGPITAPKQKKHGPGDAVDKRSSAVRDKH